MEKTNLLMVSQLIFQVSPKASVELKILRCITIFAGPGAATTSWPCFFIRILVNLSLLLGKITSPDMQRILGLN